MIKSCIKTAWRNLVRHRGATLVKLAGLSIGMACCMLILVYLTDELSYNRFNTHYHDIYRVNFIQTQEGGGHRYATAPNSVGPAIAHDIPQVAAVARLYSRGGIMEAHEGGKEDASKRFQESNIFFADSSLFDIFSVQWKEGSAAAALTDPGSVVLTDEMARKYFGNKPALGRSLLYENKLPLRVSGVVKRMPDASDLQFDFLVPFETLYSVETKFVGDFLRSNWLFNPTFTFVRLPPGQERAPVESALHQILKKYGDDRVRKLYDLALQPLADLHLHASNVEGNPSTNNIVYIYIFGGIAALILLIANINFINLSNAQSLTRINEIGIRKVSGAGTGQLIGQFLGESLLLSLGSCLLAWGLTMLGLPLLNGITGKALGLGSLLGGQTIALFALLLFCSGLLAGLYPAIFITRFKLTALLKGHTGVGGGGRLIRQSLIVTQFAIAIALIIGAVVIGRQLNYLRNKPLGFDKNALLVLRLFGDNVSPLNLGVDGPLRARMNSFENDLRQYHAVRGVSLSSVLPGEFFVLGLVIPEGRQEQDNIFLSWVSVDYDLISTLGVPIVAGRDFSKQTGTDHLQAFIINESAVRLFGWGSPSAAIGKAMIRGDNKDGKRGHVIGVMKDFNFDKLDKPVAPMIMDVNVPRFTEFAVRVQTEQVPATLEYIHRVWDKHFPERTFDYSWLNETIDAQYKAQESLSKLVGYFAAVAIFLSCMGLFSLASFMAIQRTREIGIRKVLGAGTGSIVVLLFRDFLRLVLIALLIASPVAWVSMNGWLHDFAYRVGISWWIFLAAGGAAVAISLLTVGYQGWQAARVNPVKSLRSE
jgi:putative ABC transport system permease protein